MSERLSPYFTRAEFRCRCGRVDCEARDASPDPLLVERLDRLRERVGRPVILTSGLRCPFYNGLVGGAPDSGHLDGTEADIAVASSTERWQLLDASFGGHLFPRLGIGRGFLHVGVAARLTQHVVWTYPSG